MTDKTTPVAVSVFGVKLLFADGTPVTQEHFENEPSQAAMDRAEAIDEDELDKEIEILDKLRENPDLADELAEEGGISYRVEFC